MRKLLFLILLNNFILANSSLDIIKSYYITDKDLSIDEVKKIGDFKLSEGNNFGIIEDYCWLKIEIKNNTDEEIKRFFRFDIPFLDQIIFFDLNKEAIYLGQLEKFNYDIESIQNASFFTNIEAKQEKVLYLRLKSSFAIKTFLIDYDEKEYLDDLQFRVRIFDFIYGILFAMVIYNFFIYLNIREKSYLYYVLFHFVFILGIISWTGFGFKYIWPDMPMINNYTYGVLGNLIYAFNIMLLIYFLDTDKYLPKLSKILRIFVVVSLLFSFSSLFIQLNSLYEMFSMITTSVSLYVIFYLMLIKKLTIAKYFLIAKLFLMGGNLLLILSEFGIIKGSFFIDNSYIWGVVIEVILMSLALSYKYKNIEKKRIIEKEKREETEKLLIMNHKLSTIGEMINFIIHQWKQPLAEINSIIFKIETKYLMNQLNDGIMEKEINRIEKITIYLSEAINTFKSFTLNNSNKEFYSFDLIFSDLYMIIDYPNSFNNTKIHIINEKRILEIKTIKEDLLQVIIIIINNAKEAFLDENDNKIDIVLDENSDYYKINIVNNGPKIKDNDINKIFNSNYSTKNNNNNHGLGLYIAKLIVTNSLGGTIDVSSNDNFTEFKVKLRKSDS